MENNSQFLLQYSISQLKIAVSYLTILQTALKCREVVVESKQEVMSRWNENLVSRFQISVVFNNLTKFYGAVSICAFDH